VVLGQGATFTAQTIGATPLAFQWYFNTNTPIVNATNAKLTLASVQMTDAGVYTVVASNLFGSATSSVAVLTIGPGILSIVGSPELTNGIFHVQFSGISNQAYAVDRATNILGPWQLSYTNLTSGPAGLFDLFDPASPPMSALYYRVRYP
jgi:hypothetical protein